MALLATLSPALLGLIGVSFGLPLWLAFVAVVGAAAAAAFTLGANAGSSAADRLVARLLALADGTEAPELHEGDLEALGDPDGRLERLALFRVRLDELRADVRSKLKDAPTTVTAALAEIERGHDLTEEAVEETASLLANINTSIKGINAEVDSLSRSTEEASSSILEMGSAIEEVARSAGSLHDTVDASTSSLHEMSASIRQVADSTDAVQSMAEESAAAMVQMDRAIQEVSQHVGEASELTEKLSSGADQGTHAVGATIQGIERSFEQVREARTVLERLATRINEIGEIVNVIGGINDETNLLSLNAAIIAAQAGEQGKAFAVVANHVKTLAQRTSTSTKEIEGLIAAVQDESSNAVSAMGAGMEAVEMGMTRSRVAGDELDKIRNLASEASNRVAEIARATGEQTRNSKHVAEAAQNTSSMVQQITTAVTEQSRAGEEMLRNAETALDMCRSVHRSTEEQRESGRFITASISAISEMIRSIHSNTESHGTASVAVSEAVERILETASRSGDEIPKVVEAIATLRAEATRLLQEDLLASGAEPSRAEPVGAETPGEDSASA
ncbi:MAG: methyl-accepting chemotaxis protein [Myxococcota bacterium]|nr:methyl-accepting chemotaxis protein [Myxococcota bacterium]